MQVQAPLEERYDEALTDGALALVGRLHEELDARRRELLDARQELQARLDAGGSLEFVTAPEDFTVAPVPDALQDRRVEITGPTSRKMVINALNSGARGFMADFEDSNSPYWSNMVEGQVNLADAIRGSIEHDENGKHYELGDDPAVLHVRPRGLHLPEAHLEFDGEPVAGAFVDFGLYVHRNAEALLERGWGPYFYIPKLESHHEAALWRDAFVIAEDDARPRARHDQGDGPDRDDPGGVLHGRDPVRAARPRRGPERRPLGLHLLDDQALPLAARVRDAGPLRRHDDRSVHEGLQRPRGEDLPRARRARDGRDGGRDPVAHRRGGEPAAFESVKADKEREAKDGFDGTWVAHPDSVPVAMEAFDAVLGERPNQVDKQRDDVEPSADALLDVASTPGERTEEGLRSNVNVGIQYISSWLRGNGAAGDLRPDGGRRHRGDRARPGLAVDPPRRDPRRRPHRSRPSWCASCEARSSRRSARRSATTSGSRSEGRPDLSRSLFERVALSEEFIEFLTLPAYEELLHLER